MIRKHFLFWGAADDDEGTEEPEGTEEETHPSAVPTTRELTAEELEAMTARAADRASRKARKDLADELGFESVTKFTEWAKEQKEAEKAQMDERERAIAEAKEAKAEAEALRQNYASDRLDLAVARHVVAAGIADQKKADRVTALVRLDLDPDLVNEDEESWTDAITAALSAVKEDTPELFGKAKGFGSGDGGAQGESLPPEDKEAELKKKYEDQFAAKGLITYDPDSF